MEKKFTIGILECDYFNDHLRVKYGSYSKMFQNLLSAVNPHLSFKTYNTLFDHYPQSLNECEAYLITGSKYSVYESFSWIKKLQNFVYVLHQHKKKLTGICFGHQIIAKALGGQVNKSPNGWGVGTYSNRVITTTNKPWMKPLATEFRIIVSHQDQVMRLPHNAELIATNHFCQFAAFQVEQHILCFQGHPEFTPNYAHERMLSRKDLIGEPAFKQGLQSLQHPTDHDLVARWVLNFLMH